MTVPSPRTWNLRRFDAQTFAEAGDRVGGENALGDFERLSAEQHPDAVGTPSVSWSAQGALRSGAAGQASVWMHLCATLELQVGCQRCLGAVRTPLAVDRWFRFVADEATAEAEDDDSEEDVLALEPKPDLLALIEDELLMALPQVPMHEVCPVPLQARTTDPGAQDDRKNDRPHPFAALAKLKK